MNAWTGFLLRYLMTGIGVSLLLVAFIPRPPETTPPNGPHAADDRRAAAVQADLERIADSGQHFVDLVENIVPAAETRRPIASTATSSRWAVVASPKAPYYDLHGAFQGQLPPGEVLDVIEVRDNRGEPLAVCRNSGDPNRPRILVRTTDLDLHPGALDRIGFEVQRLHAERVRLKIEIDTRIAQRETQLRADNPYADAYATAREELQAYARRITTLREGHGTSEGADRMHYANALRSMKGRDITLRTNLENAKSQYEEWNRRHPDPVPTDTGIASLTEELDRIERQLEAHSSVR